MTQTPDQVPSDIERIADLVGQMFKILESRHEYSTSLRIEIPALEADWSSVERNVLTLGRRRRAIEAPLPPLPEPRGAAAAQNWLAQRRAQGARALGWVERLPAALALLRSLGAIEAFGRTYPLPDADEQRAEALRSQMRQAVFRQDLSSMDSLLLRIQASLIRDGQRRTDLTRIVDSRMAKVVPTLDALALRDATSVPELQRWQADARTSTAMLADALSRWDVVSAREAEAKLNALADEVPEIRKRIEGELSEAEAAATARELMHRDRTARLSELRNDLDARNLFWRSMRAGGAVIGVLGLVGALLGLGVVAVILALRLTTQWYGFVALSTPITLAVVGAGIGAIVGALRLRARRHTAAKESVSVGRQIESEARALADLHKRAESIRSTLGWFRI